MNERNLAKTTLEIVDPTARPQHLDEPRAEIADLRTQVETRLIGTDVSAELPKEPAKTPLQDGDPPTMIAAVGDTAPSMLLPPAREVAAEHHEPDDASSQGEIDETPLATGTLFGRYRIERVLGTGGMGIVYLAQDTRLGRQVALKIPRFDSDGKLHLIERFRREARVMALVQHRNLCPIIDVDQHDGRHYLTMAWIDGVPLSQVLSTRSSEALDGTPAGAAAPVFTSLQIAVWIRKLATALDAAHRAGVVHRDLKPANVIIDQSGEPILMDFGLAWMAHETDSQVTLSGAIIGTPAYMSPEQAECEPKRVGAASDIYSLGVILYELLAGCPIRSGSVTRVLYLLTHEIPPRPSEIRSGVDLQLEEICWKAIARRPEDRFATAAEFAEALSRYHVAASDDVSTLPSKTGKHRRVVQKPQVTRRSKKRIVLACALLLGIFGVAAAVVPGRMKPFTQEIVQSPLTGTGEHLQLAPTGNSIAPVHPSYVHSATSFTGTWSADVPAAWQGTFTGLGRNPAGNTGDHTAEFDFSGLTSGVLPVGTYLLIADLDTIERLTLKAYDADHHAISRPWINRTPLEQHGSGTGVGFPGSILPTDLPGWDWNESTQTYAFDVTTIVGNPNLSFTLSTREAIVFLEVTREVTGFGLSLMAPAANP